MSEEFGMGIFIVIAPMLSDRVGTCFCPFALWSFFSLHCHILCDLSFEISVVVHYFLVLQFLAVPEMLLITMLIQSIFLLAHQPSVQYRIYSWPFFLQVRRGIRRQGVCTAALQLYCRLHLADWPRRMVILSWSYPSHRIASRNSGRISLESACIVRLFSQPSLITQTSASPHSHSHFHHPPPQPKSLLPSPSPLPIPIPFHFPSPIQLPTSQSYSSVSPLLLLLLQSLIRYSRYSAR